MCVSVARDARGQLHIDWREGPKLPMPLGGHSAGVTDEGIVVAGGSNWPGGTKVWRDEVHVLRDGAWHESGKLQFGLALAASVVNRGQLVLMGGSRESGTICDVFWHHKGLTHVTGNNMPIARALAGGAIINQQIFIVGGSTDAADFTTAMAGVMRLDRSGWKQVAPLPQALTLSATVALGGSIYVFGGMGPDGPSAIDSASAYRYGPQKDQWTSVSALPSARRGAGVVAVDDRYIVLIGGCRNEKDVPVMLNEVLAYDTREDRYHVCTPLPYSALCVGVVVKHGEIYAIGGEDLPRHRTDRVVIGRISKPEK